jgi:predicted transcriptional regulator
MPRTKLQRLTRSADEKIISTIWGLISARKISIEDFTRATGIPPTTLYRRRRQPEDFTLAELRRVGRYLDIPVDEFRQICLHY